MHVCFCVQDFGKGPEFWLAISVLRDLVKMHCLACLSRSLPNSLHSRQTSVWARWWCFAEKQVCFHGNRETSSSLSFHAFASCFWIFLQVDLCSRNWTLLILILDINFDDMKHSGWYFTNKKHHLKVILMWVLIYWLTTWSFAWSFAQVLKWLWVHFTDLQLEILMLDSWSVLLFLYLCSTDIPRLASSTAMHK